MQQQVIQWIWNHLITIALGSTTLIQVLPIKVNPWSALFKWIGGIITKDLDTKISNIHKQVNKLELDVMTNEKDRIRYEVLDFANSCRNGRRHTKDEFEHIVELNKKYKRLLKATKDENGVFELEYNYISELYAERLKKNDFL